LEIPCKLVFTGDPKYIQKVKKAMSFAGEKSKLEGKPSKEAAPQSKDEDIIVKKEPAAMRVKVNSANAINQVVWVRIFSIVLKMSDQEILSMGQELTDAHMNAAQKLILHQFPTYQGLKNTLLKDSIGFWTNNYIQVLHCRGCHWITVSTIGCHPGEVDVYDSLYTDVDDNTKCKIEKVFGSRIKFNLARVRRQAGFTDCGAFAVAFATSLAFGRSNFMPQQDQLRPHLQRCFEERYIQPFP